MSCCVYHVWPCLCRRIASRLALPRNITINIVIVKSKSQVSLGPIHSLAVLSSSLLLLLQCHSAPRICWTSSCANPEILPPPPTKTGEPPWLVTCMNLGESGRRLVTRQKRGAGPSSCSSQEPRGARVFSVAEPSALHHPTISFPFSSCSRSQAHAVTQVSASTFLIS